MKATVYAMHVNKRRSVMVIDSIVARQRDWLMKLQGLTNKPILIQRHTSNVWHPWQDDIPSNPYHTRNVLPCELCLDSDVRNWATMKQGMDRVINFMESEKIPYILAYSGGKGCHSHIFIDPNIHFPDDVNSGLKSYNIDVVGEVRVFLTNWIFSNAGVRTKDIELDFKKISLDRDGKGSMIRILGSRRKIEDPDNTGKFYITFKTMIDKIPDQKPDAKAFSLPLRFPERIQLWSISHLQNDIIKMLESKIEQCERNQASMQIARLKRLTTPHTGNRGKCIGLQNAEIGVIAGIRDEVATGLICACKKWMKIDPVQCCEFMYQWAGRCSPAFELAIIDYKIGRIYNTEQTYSPCGFFKESGLCKGSQCRIIKR